MNINAFTVDNIPMITKDDDIADIICQRTLIEEHDIILIASTIISKAQDRIIDPDKIVPTQQALNISKKNGMDAAFVQAVLDESDEVILESPIFLVRHHCGNICIDAGIDQSNVADGLLLLPVDPDESAKKLKDDLFRLTGKKVSVVITDTNGRAFREGQTGFAIGAAGIMTHHDWRGSTDLFDNVLEVANEAVVDEVAGFANCLMGEGNWGMPVVVIRGLDLFSDNDGVGAVYRLDDTDIIKKALKSF